jgi:predicted GNAT family N-acyltransferase
MKSRIYQTTWQLDGMRLGALRREVFVVEQNVPEELEWDEFMEHYF